MFDVKGIGGWMWIGWFGEFSDILEMLASGFRLMVVALGGVGGSKHLFDEV